MTRRLGWLPLLLLLAACAARAPLPAAVPALDLPLQLHVRRVAGGEQQDWLLVIQAENGALRWSLLDPLGMPKARQVLRDGAWHADGLLPPNPEARELFAALLFALADQDALERDYPGLRWQAAAGNRTLYQGASPRWRVHYRDRLDFDLALADGLQYRIEPLPGAAP
jgi:hypothetical protein